MLSDEELIEVYALNCDCEGTRVMLNGLRAVAEAAVKDAVGGVVVAEVVKVHGSKTVFWEKSLPVGTKLYTRPQASAAVPEGWREVMQGLVECARDEIVRCEGMKCREPNCISCNDELEATTSVERSREFVFRARAMLAASQPEVKS